MFSGPDAVLETRLLVAVQVAVALAIALLSGWSRPRASAAGAAGEAPLDPGATAPATRRRP